MEVKSSLHLFLRLPCSRLESILIDIHFFFLLPSVSFAAASSSSYLDDGFDLNNLKHFRFGLVIVECVRLPCSMDCLFCCFIWWWWGEHVFSLQVTMHHPPTGRVFLISFFSQLTLKQTPRVALRSQQQVLVFSSHSNSYLRSEYDTLSPACANSRSLYE